MTASSRSIRRPLIAVVTLTLVSSLAACTPEPSGTPTPTPTGFATEEEAFAAAEETYRAHVAALNLVDLANPETFEAMFDLSSGDFLESDEATFDSMHQAGYTLTGKTRVISFDGESTSKNLSTVVARACVDVSQVEITDASGASQVASNRADIYPLELVFIQSDARKFLIDSAAVLEEESCEPS